MCSIAQLYHWHALHGTEVVATLHTPTNSYTASAGMAHILCLIYRPFRVRIWVLGGILA